jgi:signal transduction histidine kinase/CheY-like chemotaxis protein
MTQEIQDNWIELINVDNSQKLNTLYNLELVYNSLDTHLTSQIGLRQNALLKNTDILVYIGLISGILAMVFISLARFKTIRIEKLLIADLNREKEDKISTASFLSVAGHELRTPLNGIIGLSDILRKSNLPIEESNYADNVFHSGKALLKIINNILEYAKIDSGVIDLEFSEFSLGATLQQIITTFSTQAKEKNIKFNYLIDEDIPINVFGDQSRISQVLFNFIGNAINHTISGAIIIRIKVLSKNVNSNLKIYFSVEDTGIGLTEEQINGLYKPLKEIHKISKIGESHPGLGFARCNQLVKAMGGEIEVSSKVGVGSVFAFTANFAKFSSEVLGPNFMKRYHYFDDHKAINPIFDKDDRPTILIADDNPANLLMVKVLLERLGAKVLAVANGKEIISEFSKEKVDLILIDCQMPIMDGFEATKILRNNKVSIPIIAMSASNTSNELSKCLSVGMNGLISKPIELEVIKSELIKSLQLDSCDICLEAIERLETKMGYTGMNLTVKKFLDELPLCEESLDQCLKDNNIQEIHRIGSQLRTSSQIVGAKGMANLFKRLEMVEKIDDQKNKEEIINIKNEIISASTKVKNKLSDHVTYLH